MTDTEWQAIKQNFERDLAEIVIPADINPGIAKPLISKLDALYTKVMLIYPKIKTDDDNINQLLSNTMKIAATIGKNADERSANTIIAAQKYILAGEEIDLFSIKSVCNQRLVYITSLIKILEVKRGNMITASGLMKIESTF